jgi:hypothetical protein
VCTIVLGGATLITALYIIINGLGLNENFDFGAGAYYYADIPQFEKLEKTTYQTSVPRWVHIILFLIWGFLMYKLWVWIDKKTQKQDQDEK